MSKWGRVDSYGLAIVAFFSNSSETDAEDDPESFQDAAAILADLFLDSP